MTPQLLDEKVVFQVCFITDDLEKTAGWFCEFFDEEMPNIITTAPQSETQIEYLGKPSEARCRLAIFSFGNTDIELIEPDEHPSCWRDFLDRHGPGCHHIAFKVQGMKEKIMKFEAAGAPLLQKGEFTGGRYAYVDTEAQLGALIELLEIDKK
ncbi:MAG: VOC family protein [Pseudomonadota bacterium]